jgi:glycosyltransferase involved in cell wall biosynthesis
MVDVAFLGRFGTCCGVATYTEQLAEQLVKADSFEVAAVASVHGHQEQGPHRTDCVEGIKTISCWGEDSDFDEAYQVILDLQPSILHVQHEHGIFRNGGALLDLLRKLPSLQITRILTAHTVPPEENAAMLDLITSVDGVIVHSMRAKRVLHEQCERWKLKNPPEVGHIEHGMLPPQQKANKAYARAALGIPLDKEVVVALALGFISRSKKHMVMLQVLEAVIKRQMCAPKRLFLLIAGLPDPHGGDELVRMVRQFAAQRGIAQNLLVIPEFIPFRYLPIIYGAADFTLHVRGASQISSSGSIRQDMSFGMPVLTQRSDLTEDLPYDAVTFFANEQGLLAMLPKLVRDDTMREKLSSEALLMARKFEWRRISKKHVRFYEAVMGQQITSRREVFRTALSQATHWLRKN